MASKKYYAVKTGREPGIYTDWDACRRQVTGYPGASFKGFQSLSEAEAFLTDAAEAELPEDAELLEIYVDGSFNSATGEYAWGFVALQGGEEHCEKGRPEDQSLASMHNVAGEIMGAEAAMAYALSVGADTLVLYHDYAGIANWCTGAWQAKQEGTKAYKAYYDGIRDRLEVRFVKVKGHSHNRYNDLADRLAKQAAGLEEA